MRIILEAIDPKDMRLAAYRHPGCGDWFFSHKNGDLYIQIAGPDIFEDDETFLCAFHELFEAKKCHKDGVVQGAVDAFDRNFKGEGEPGDSESSPYRRQHRAASIIEHMAAILLGRWDHGEVS